MASSDCPSAAQVRAELDRILASEIFTRSERLSAYLRFIVEQTLAGEGDALKEQVIAIELYGKGADFRTAADPIVRVDARRLRDRLREYYASAPPGVVVISVPKGSYTPEFRATAPAVTPPDDRTSAPAGQRATSFGYRVAGAAVLAIAAAGWLLVSPFRSREAEPVRLLTVTSLPGAEEDPSLSPDGNFVAFSWMGADGNPNADIWVKAVDGDAMRQLTNTPDINDKFPAWSHDGQHIAFTRLVPGASSVWMVSALGGPEKLIADRGEAPSWLPDDGSIVMTSRSPEGRPSLVQYIRESGERRQLVELPPGFRLSHPKVSPDGKAVAFLGSAVGRAAVFLTSLTGGEATQLVDWTAGLIGSLTWTPDGRDLLYSRPEMSGRRLVRLTVGSSKGPVPALGVPDSSFASSAVRRGAGGAYRVAIFRGEPDTNLRLIDLRAPRQGGIIDAVTKFSEATRNDLPGRFSGDGSLVAFMSDRSGSQQVWVARRDQSELRSVTRLVDAFISVGSWSPDGRSIAFDATIASNTDIYVASLDGGPARRLTEGPAVERDAEWSHDGNWIYYASDETGRSEIWRMSSIDGRSRAKLTSDGGFDPRESPDGQYVYFVADTRWYGLGTRTRLSRVPAQGGAASLVYPDIVAGAWGLAGDRVVFLVPRRGSDAYDEPDVVATYDLVRRRMEEVGPLSFRVAPAFANRFLAISPDGRWALAPHIDRYDRDILVLDNFR
ncbi:MAG TPA: hypothetical protein VD833_00090 [Vicinamibacterales bacterium]|nr:hypothetical protein [Vicinamibacterales bacterium]